MKTMTITLSARGLACALAAALPAAGLAFEGETHIAMTAHAYDRTVIAQAGPGTLLEALGIERLGDDRPFRAYWTSDTPSYFDNVALGNPPADPFALPVNPRLRPTTDYEKCQFEKLAGAHWLTAWSVSSEHMVTWLMRGVTREDDIDGIFKPVCNGVSPDPDIHGDFKRVYNHFYDPINDRPLTTFGVLNTHKSVDWALGYSNSFAATPSRDANRRNHFSYADARDNYWLALTARRQAAELPYDATRRAEDAHERQRYWATTFRALGDVIHVLQDAAQPQHVRNDPHSPAHSKQQEAFEGYTNARLLGGEVNPYIHGFFDRTQPMPRPPNLVLGSYDKVMFATPLRFFTTRAAQDGPGVSPDARLGMADYANRGFFTSGTTPGEDHNFTRPPTLVDATNGYTVSDAPCRFSDWITTIGADCRHWLRTVPDTVRPDYDDTLPPLPNGGTFPQSPLVAESIYGEIRDHFGLRASVGYALGLEEFQNIANLAVPRAIAYSAGMIDYFFRGRITLTSPPDGLYAVIDQGKPHTVTAGMPLLDDNRTFGFTTVRVRARNSTADILESGSGDVVAQSMGQAGASGQAGLLVAVMRYHRNPCYSRTLGGERVKVYASDGSIERIFIPDNCTITRSDPPEISVSKPIVVAGNGDLPGAPAGSENSCANVGNINTGATGTCANDSALLEFDFSDDPMPINATDVFIQVVYRGRLGLEPDGIAVGARDISEPQYYTMWNNSDWMLHYTDWKRRADVPWPPGPDSDEARPFPVTNGRICFYRQVVAHLPMSNALYERQFMRVGVLADLGQLYMGGIGMVDNSYTAHTDELMPVVRRQASRENGEGWNTDLMIYGRGTTLGSSLSLLFKAWPNDNGYGFAKAAKLEPALETEAGIGIPTQSVVRFSSEDDPICSNFFAGSGIKNYVEQRPSSSGTTARGAPRTP